MAKAGIEDKRQPQDRAAQQGVGGETISRGEKVFHHSEFLKWIGTNQMLVETDVFRDRVKVARGQIVILPREIGGDGDAVQFSFPKHVATGRK